MGQKSTIKYSLEVKNGTNVKGINTLFCKTLKQKICVESSQSTSSGITCKTPNNRHTNTILSLSLPSLCQMNLWHFPHRNRFWYFTSLSSFQHSGHPHLLSSAKPFSISNVNTQNSAFYYSLYNGGVAPGQASNFMTPICGKGTLGTLLSKTILNINAKT